MRCPIFTLAWTPEGRRLVTGASSGEFTLWNGLTFNFETILQVHFVYDLNNMNDNLILFVVLQAHDCPVRTMVWSHNDNWMVTGDHQGNVKYWQSNMNNVRQFQAHKDPVRGIRYKQTQTKRPNVRQISHRLMRLFGCHGNQNKSWVITCRSSSALGAQNNKYI